MSGTRKREPFSLELYEAERAALERIAEREHRSLSAQVRVLILQAAETDKEAA